jgi:hypothetical protein
VEDFRGLLIELGHSPASSQASQAVEHR